MKLAEMTKGAPAPHSLQGCDANGTEYVALQCGRQPLKSETERTFPVIAGS